jgi:hypothetical protein
MLRSQTLRDRLAEHGRAWVLERFTQERQVRETAELYLEALGHAKESQTGAERRQAVAQ